MKIWVQSGSALAADTATPYGRRYEELLARHLKTLTRAGTRIESRGIPDTPYGKDRYRAAFHRVTTLMIQSALRAEKAGFDAIAVINTFDHGYRELREVTRLPVVFITESSMHLAAQFATRIGFVTHNRSILRHCEELARRYRLEGFLVRGAWLNLTYEDFIRMYAYPEPYLDAFREAARPVIERGAEILLVSGNPVNLFLIDHGLREVDGVPVLDGCAALIKTAEMMVDLDKLGLRRGGTPPEEDRTRLRAIFE